MTDSPWWKSAVIYQIYPRSFADASGDGVGDLEGIRTHLDHLEWLGVDAVWVSPFYRSPMADFGYDVSDYCDVDPLFGTLADFQGLLGEVHERGMRMIVDWVPNHTSDQHPWFVEARSSRDSPKRDWYIWRDASPDQPPNNWAASFGGQAWAYDAPTEQWYLHLFLPEQPDLNWRNPEVVEAMHDTLRFWLDIGVDGFRIDVVHGLGKNPELPDTRGGQLGIPQSALNDEPSTHELIRGFRTLVDSYPGDRMMVGEVFLLSTSQVATYYGRGDELHLAFNFTGLYESWDAERWRRRIQRVAEELDPIDAWPTWVLSNHDNPRHRSRYGGSEARAGAAAVLLLTLRGTPFVYQGEELGLLNAEIPPERRVDPGGRDGCRAPIPWTAADGHGWPSSAWLPLPPESDTRNVETLRPDDQSILRLYRHLLAARHASPALQLGDIQLVDAPEGVVAYERVAHDDRRLVLVNLSAESVTMPLSEPWLVELTSNGAEFTGELGPDQAVMLRPA